MAFGDATPERLARWDETRRKAAQKQAQKARKPLPVASKKRRKEQTERTAMIREVYPERPRCAVPFCTRMADDLHEVLSRARGGSITDPENCVPLCRPHHNAITDTEPAWAYELGLLKHSWDAA